MDNKEKAVKLRENGKTCGEIVAILGTPKSTIWSWIKNANLSDKIKKEILKRSKINAQNNIGKTLWHYLVIHDIWDRYNDIIIQQKNKIFIDLIILF